MSADGVEPQGLSVKRRFRWRSILGPGLVTGAADDDPSGIATYSQAGAQFGTGLLWSIVITYPLMVAIQLISARIGRVTGKGLIANVREFYPPWLSVALVGLLLLANTLNIAADIAAMGESLQLIVGGPSLAYAVGFGMLCVLLEVFIPYHRYEALLKWLTMSLFAYVLVILVLHVDWVSVLRATFLPSLSLQPDYLITVVGLFGTTITPYLFFWQASQEVEEMAKTGDAGALRDQPSDGNQDLTRIWWDTIFGMGFSNIVSFCIILAAALTLNAHGITDIATSGQAAEALRPIAGAAAFFLFAAGIIGTGLLAVPVLAGSAAYAAAEAMHWHEGLELKLLQARGFYAILAAATLIGTALCFVPIDPIRLLFYAAVINGVIAVPVMATMMLIVSREVIMKAYAAPNWLRVGGWLATALMAVAVLAMFASLVF